MTVSKTRKIPTQDELEAVLGSSRVSDTKYERYYKPYFEYLYSLAPDEVATDIELYDQAGGDFSRSTYRKYLKHTIEFDPSLELKVVGYVYHVDAFIEQNAAAHNFSDIGKYINRVQQTCLTTYRNSKDEYAERLIHYLRTGIETRYKGDLNDIVPPDVVEELLDEYESALAETLPSKVTSMNQSGKNMAGKVNEALFLLALESSGLQKKQDFKEMSSGSDTGDIRVWSEVQSADPFNIEAKSSKNRERGEFGVSSVDPPSGLLGFFDDPDEMIQTADKLDSECHVVYLPPFTLAQMSRKTHSAYSMDGDKTGKLFFRANNEFGSDMKYYHQNGSLPAKSVGHERKYLTATWGR